MKKSVFSGIALAALLALPLVAAADSTTDAAIGGGLGGAAGAAIGNELGGRDGAIVGSAIGGAAGAAITTRPEPRREVRIIERPVYIDGPGRGGPPPWAPAHGRRAQGR